MTDLSIVVENNNNNGSESDTDGTDNDGINGGETNADGTNGVADNVPEIYRQISNSISTLDLAELNKKLTDQLDQEGIPTDINSAVSDLCSRIHLLSNKWLSYSNRYKWAHSFFTFIVVGVTAAIAVIGYNNDNFVEAVLNTSISVLMIIISILKLPVNSAIYRNG